MNELFILIIMNLLLFLIEPGTVGLELRIRAGYAMCLITSLSIVGNVSLTIFSGARDVIQMYHSYIREA